MNNRGLYGAVPLSHYFMERCLCQGDDAIDATCGNGQDTLLLARLVGDRGRVWGFDIQAGAIVSTRGLVESSGFGDRVTLFQAGHERMAEFITGPVKAVIFNLGYLPTGDRGVKTEVGSTIAALDQSLGLLQPGGMTLVALYTGHDGGDEEWQGGA